MDESTESVRRINDTEAAVTTAMQFFASNSSQEVVRAACDPGSFSLDADQGLVLRSLVIRAVYREQRSL